MDQGKIRRPSPFQDGGGKENRPAIARGEGRNQGPLTVPYLYGLSRLLGVGAVFTVGTAMTVVSLLFLWAG